VTKPLEGIKILDMTRIAAGPYCTMLLTSLGAEVIKVEEPGVGDGQRKLRPFVQDVGYTFLALNRSKKSVTLNLKTEKGKQIFRELVEKGQVVVENFSSEAMTKMGLSYEDLKKVNPQIIYVSISGFGHSGPYSSKIALDPVVQAMSGIMSLTGERGSPPMRVGVGIADLVTPVYAAVATLAAIIHLMNTGQGQFIDISMQDCMFANLVPEFLGDYVIHNRVLPKSGNRHPFLAPLNCYKASNGYIVIAVNSNEWWNNLLKLIGKEELIGDSRFSRNRSRVENVDEVDALIQSWTQDKSIAEVINLLGEAHIPCGPALTVDQLANDPHLLAREMIKEVDYPQPIGKLKIPGSPLKLSAIDTNIESLPPSLGEHNEQIYSELLGYDSTKIATLKEEGII